MDGWLGGVLPLGGAGAAGSPLAYLHQLSSWRAGAGISMADSLLQANTDGELPGQLWQSCLRAGVAGAVAVVIREPRR
ncbi:hypothetical protein [Arthrobacter psychrolactophilus]|uniref:hypothetical protein n=1 Tax=Arthrobacter psychrolactophilus TaxID=92442 RepID=UPI0011B6BAC7|nr:hypothetical protein [Arthrobacter psychrolactophilus]